MKYSILLNDEGISPVIGTVLLLAIGMTVLMTVQLNFVPVWNQQEELNHLEIMNDDFKELKSSIESSAVSGTSLSVPLTMGFKYSPKIIVYNPRESAQATFSIQKDVWAEVRYNELNPEGMDDATSIKNITSTTISYALQSSHNLSYLIYEHGLIRRSTSNYTPSAQALVSNSSLYILAVNATDPETTSSVERRIINIYPTSPAKNSVIGKNVWLTLHTKYVDWWADDPNNPSSIQNLGGTIYKKDNASGIIIAYFDRMEIRLGETQVTTRSKKPPERLQPYRLVKITPQNVNLPVVGMNSLVVEVQDFYNNPVPNVLVNFSINSTRIPGNAYSTALLLQNSAISGADGRANIQLKTSGAGLYYIDAGIPASNTTFTYPASSQGGFISLSYTGAGPSYTITATLRNESGQPSPSQQVSFAAGEGTVTPGAAPTDANGNASTTLDTGAATGLKITNIQTGNVTNSSANITWNTVNTITVAANRTPGGYIFGNIDVTTNVSSNGCVRYGTSPGTYPYLSSCDSNTASHFISLTGLQPYTAYYFIVNSSRPGGASINSSEYMFVTQTGVVPDTTPPASVTALNNVTYVPLYINWTWTDPADSDFKEVQIYIDGTYKTTVAKGVNSFNASYFSPNSTHTISTHTVDTSGNVNTAWVNNTANTSDVFTYVFGFLNTTGTVTNFPAAQNASDGGASTLFSESLTGGTSESNNNTYVTSNTTTNGTIFNWVNMQSATDGGAFATLTEAPAATTRSDRTNNPGKTYTNGTQFGSYTSSNLDNTDGAIDITIPAITGTTTSKGYLMNTAKTGVGGTLYWNINTTNGAVSDTSTIITLGGTANRNYTFRPGQNNNKVTGTPGAAPAGYGWISSTSVNGITSAGTWSFQVRTVSSINTRNGRILVYVYKYNATDGTNTFLFSASGTANHLGTTAGTTELITSSAQPEYVFNSDEYLKVEYWLNAITTSNGATLTFQANTVTPYVQYSENMYSLNTTYTFTEINLSSTWQSLSINDISYGDNLANVSILNATSGRWESILTGAFTGGATPTEHVNVIKGASGNASSYDSGGGQIKLMYNWTNNTFNDTLGIDLINVTVFYTANTYLLNITTNTVNVPPDTNYYLEINHSRDASETGYDVYVFNGTAWNFKGSLTPLTWYLANFTLSSSEVINGNVSVLYLDQTPTGTTQGNLFIDYQRIHGNTPALPAAYRLNVITNTTSVPDAANQQVLQLRYNVSGDNFTVQVWNGSDWDYRTTLNDTVISYRNITLLPGDLQSDGAFTSGSVGDLNKFYVLVRYTDVNASPVQQGKLYLDYQRVYST